MSAGTLSQEPRVRRILDSCRRQIVAHTLIRGLATVLIVALTAVLLATLTDYLIGMPPTARMVCLVAAIGLTGATVWATLVSPLRDTPPPEQLGAAVDLSCPDLDESLATLLSLQAPDVTPGEAGSEVMRSHLREHVHERLNHVQADRIVDSRTTQKRSGVAASLLFLALIPVVFWPSGTGLLLQRMVRPYANLATATNLYFKIENGNRTVARGSNVLFAATPMWRTEIASERPEKVEVQMISDSGRRETMAMVFDELSGNYVAQLDRITDSLQYRVAGGGAQTELFALTVVDAPEIRTAIMSVSPPDYTGRAIHEFDGMIGEMEVFERSEMEILLEFNKPVESAALLWIRRDPLPVSEVEEFNRTFDHVTGEEVIAEPSGDWDPSRTAEEKAGQFDPEDQDPDAPLQPEIPTLTERVEGTLSGDGRSALIRMPADAGGEFVFEILDRYTLPNPSEPERSIKVIYDQPPQLKVTGARTGDRFRPDDILPVDAFAIDDIGIGALELHYRINEDVTRIIAADDFEHGRSEIEHGFRMLLHDLEVATGDFVTLRVRAADERPEPGPQQTWSDEIRIEIDENAKAAGAQAMAEETKAMVQALKQLEKEIIADRETTKQLQEESRKKWAGDTREQARRLSEKEQQQGRALEQIAQQVATHPLMEEAAEQLQDLSGQLKDDIPDNLDEAADADRTNASKRLEEAEQQLERVQQGLAEQIAEIEERAKLEQDLAELNRLALEAEQLAADADQLDQDRSNPENQPEELDSQEWQQQLDSRQQQLSEHREDLSDDLGRLLQEKQELLEAAQRAQREQLQEISEQARELAQQQERVAEGVKEEAKEAARDAHELAQELDRTRRDAEELNRELQEMAPQAAQTDSEKLQQAAQELRQGNLAEPQAAVEEAAEELNNTKQQLQQNNDDNDASDDATQQQRQQAADRSAELAERMEDIGEQIAKLRSERNADAPNARNDEAGDAAAPSSDPQAAAEQNASEQNAADPVANLLDRLSELTEAADEMANSLESDPSAQGNAPQDARQAAEQAQQGTEQASAGRFSKAAQEMRRAGDAAQKSAQQMNAAGQEDRKSQMADLSSEFSRAAQSLENMKLDDAAQAAAQQASQQQISEAASQLPGQLAELSERMAMEELQMANESRQTAQAQQTATQAQQSSRQASSELNSGQLQQAAQSGQQTAEELKQIAGMAEQAGQQPGGEQSPVPAEVGESVADALQNLAQAAQAMQQSSEQTSNGQQGQSDQSSEQSAGAQSGQPGEGDQAAGAQSQQGQPGEQGQQGQGQSGQGQPGQQSGQGQPSGSQQLSSAAQALAQAAKDALPSQFTPGQNSDGSESSASGADATGNTAMWDGLLPNRSAGSDGSRNWGRPMQELDTETSDGVRITRDSEYQALIRMYFREVAKATSGNGD